MGADSSVEYERARVVDIGFYARGPGKSQIAVQVRRLDKKSAVEPVRRRWRAALGRLRNLLED